MYAVTTFYLFVALSPERIATLKTELSALGERLALQGLVLLAPEGINATVSGFESNLTAFKQHLTERIPELGPLTFKDSWAETAPFRRFKIDLRAEIVAADMPGVFPQSPQNHHLSPQEWHAILESEPDVLVLDTRNDYETRIGKFKNALDPNLKTFGEFPQFVEASGIPKDQKILMYCTGGIRCEKAILTMQERGYENVYQLQGGILKYFEAFPEGGAYEGECFLFDHRVAVDSHLHPSQKYGLCPHCGDPAEIAISCAYCGSAGLVCPRCQQTPACSKNCAYHVARGTPPKKVALGQS